MKVIQINTTYGQVGSTPRTSFQMHSWLIEHGVDSKVYCAYINDGSKTEGVQEYSTRLDRKIHALLSRITGLQGYYSYGVTNRLIKCLSNDKPDIVLLRVLHSNCINFPRLFRYFERNDISIVIVLHDCWFLSGHCVDLFEGRCDRWISQCGNCPRIREDNPSWFFDTSKRCLRDKKEWYGKIKNLAVVGVSQYMTRVARSSILREAQSIQCIYNWIDQSQFYPKNKAGLRKQYGYSEDEILILGIASTWMERKGIIEMAKVAQSLPACKVVLIGECEREIFKQTENVILVGTVRQTEQLADYYNMADVYLNPSHMESFGKTTAEAICCGCPVVSYRTGASEELVESTGGELADLGDLDGFVKAVERMIKRDDKRLIREKELEFANASFNMEKNLMTYFDLFQELAG